MLDWFSPSVFLALVACLQPACAAVPSPSEWAALNQTVGGRLGVGIPFSQPCFSQPSSNTTQADECAAIQSGYEDHLFRTDHFGAFQISQWETCQTTGDECALDWTNPTNPVAFSPPAHCKQGSVPSFFINVTGPDDVLAAYAFVKRTSVPLVIKNTGHDYFGRSAGPGALALWTHNLKKLEFDQSFQPDDCSSVEAQSAIVIGAGQQFQAIYDFVKANNVTFVGGADPSVGASGGWVMGGGHSALSVTMGLGVDRVLQFKIVTPDGQLRTVNKCQNPDLFFALRGGGGGTFGVVLETAFIASPQVTLQVLFGRYDGTQANSAALIKALSTTAVQMATDGWGGYVNPPQGGAVWINPVLDATAAKTSAAIAASAFESIGGTASFFTVDSYTDFFDKFIAGNTASVGRPQALATRLIPADKFTDEAFIETFADALVAAEASQILAVAPYSFKDFDADGTAINPAWRTAVWHSMIGFTWNTNSTLTDRVSTYEKLESLWATVRELTPTSGAYLNEAHVYEPDYQKSFWGDNYERLLSIKEKYDPTGILQCWHCVGWTGAADPRYKCYPSMN